MPAVPPEKQADTLIDFSAITLKLTSSPVDVKEVLQSIKAYIEKYDLSSFQEHANTPSISLQKEESEYKATILYYAAMKDMVEIVTALIQYEVAIDKGTSCEENPSLDGNSPLMAACENSAMLALPLLLKKANLLHLNTLKMNLFMHIGSLPVLTKVREEVCLQQLNIEDLIYAVTSKGLGVHYYLCKTGQDEVLAQLLQDNKWDQLIDTESLLHYTRVASFTFPEKKSAFDALCKKIKPKTPFVPSFEVFSKETTSQLLRYESYDKLFSLAMPFIIKSKEDAVRRAISQFHCLLQTPLQCLAYLQLLNKAFSQYYLNKYKTSFPTLDYAYDFKVINGLHCPIPSASYQGIKKHCSLQGYLISIFKKYHLSQNASKWIGFISPTEAETMIKRGDFFVENRLGPGLLHGKYSHMIQLFILCCAIEDNKVSMDYSLEEKNLKITVSDILEGLVTRSERTHLTPWHVVLDTRKINLISFTDPNRLNEFIMYFGKKYELEELSDYLIDSFCKGFKAMHACYQAHGHPELTLDNLAVLMNDMDSASFTAPAFLTQFSLRREQEKKNLPLDKKSQTCGVIPKSYTI